MKTTALNSTVSDINEIFVILMFIVERRIKNRPEGININNKSVFVDRKAAPPSEKRIPASRLPAASKEIIENGLSLIETMALPAKNAGTLIVVIIKIID
ncbi:hypothetical protein KKF34_19160 [Myxococcota bacterium]|nr:hypothetical protein [Myxococcota bacterium]MBU1379272.1 hypothetical protein [Myxococcota bacterium]MBU1499008.1 hypothetical protein [Myxococcota bacterium]